MTLSRGVLAMCAAQACAQIGAFSVAAVLPALISVWALTNTEAGWINGIYYAAYTLTVPLLSSLTDRVDPKRVYLGSVAMTAIASAGFAWIASGFLVGTGVPGADGCRLGGQLHARAQGVERSGGGPAAVESRRGAGGGRRGERRALVRCRGRRQHLARLALGARAGRGRRHPRVRAGALRSAVATSQSRIGPAPCAARFQADSS